MEGDFFNASFNDVGGVLTYNEAALACEQCGLILAEPKTREELDDLTELSGLLAEAAGSNTIPEFYLGIQLVNDT